MKSGGVLKSGRPFFTACGIVRRLPAGFHERGTSHSSRCRAGGESVGRKRCSESCRGLLKGAERFSMALFLWTRSRASAKKPFGVAEVIECACEIALPRGRKKPSCRNGSNPRFRVRKRAEEKRFFPTLAVRRVSLCDALRCERESKEPLRSPCSPSESCFCVACGRDAGRGECDAAFS